MILGFKTKFRDKILSGEKIHSIREDKSNRWKPGMMIHAATGVRTKQYSQFAALRCESIQSIEIDTSAYYMNDCFVLVDGRRLTFEEVQQLAWRDGFEHLIEFYMFFGNREEIFKGKIIHWTDLKY